MRFDLYTKSQKSGLGALQDSSQINRWKDLGSAFPTIKVKAGELHHSYSVRCLLAHQKFLQVHIRQNTAQKTPFRVVSSQEVE